MRPDRAWAMDELFSEFLSDTAERLDIAEAALARPAEEPTPEKASLSA